MECELHPGTELRPAVISKVCDHCGSGHLEVLHYSCPHPSDNRVFDLQGKPIEEPDASEPQQLVVEKVVVPEPEEPKSSSKKK